MLQTLAEKGNINAEHGKASFAILLFQDIAVVPILALVPLLADSPAPTPMMGCGIVNCFPTEEAQQLLPDSLVVAAFQNVSAEVLQDPEQVMPGDVVIYSDFSDTWTGDSVTGFRPIDPISSRTAANPSSLSLCSCLQYRLP